MPNLPGTARGISHDGLVTVGSMSVAGGGVEAFRWTNSTFVSLGDLSGGAVNSRAQAASGDGSVVVGFGTSGSGTEAFRWTSGGGIIGLGDDPGGSFGSNATDVSADGAVIVGHVTTAAGQRAARWTQSTGWVVLPNAGSASLASARAVSEDGMTIVGDRHFYNPAIGSQHFPALLAANGVNVTAGSFSPASGFTIGGMNDVSNEGQVTGTDTHGGFYLEGFMVSGLPGEEITGGNNVTIGAGGNVNSDSFRNSYYSTDNGATISVTSLLAGMATGNANVRTGGNGANNEPGNLTIAAALDYNGVGLGRKLTMRATNDLVVNAAIFDSVSGGDSLDLALVANNSLVAINTPAGGGDLLINANVTANTLNLSGVTGTISSGATVSASGAATLGLQTLNVVSGATLNVPALSYNTMVNVPLVGGTISTGPTSLSRDVAGFGNLDAKTYIAPLVTVTAAGGDLTVGRNVASGFVADGDLDAGANTLMLRSAGFAQLGRTNTLSGGTIAAANGLFLAGGRTISGSGTVAGKVSTANGSTIQATGALTLGNAASPAGFVGDGELHTAANTVTLLDSNQAVLGSLTTIGDGGDGTLAAANGLYLDFGRTITGHGAINTPNNSAKPFTNNGSIEGASPGDPIELNGYVKGVGQLSNVVINGTYSPGLSPAAVSHPGDLNVSSSGALEIEIGGLQAGSQYDTVSVAGIARLHGAIVVRELNNYLPIPGQRFSVLSFGLLEGNPTVYNETSFAGLWFEKIQSAAAMALVSRAMDGDATIDGRVDIADFALLAANYNTAGNWLDGDFNADGTVGIADFALLAGNFNRVLNTAARPVPEPAGLMLPLAALIAVRRRVRG
jgi:uncharacterized membrane protein